MNTPETTRRVLFLAAVLCLSVAVQGATVTFHNEAPTPGPYDIHNLVGADRDANNIGTYDYDTWLNNETTYIAGDRPAQGQTFVTGTDRPVYLLTGVWIRHVGYTNSSTTGATNNGTWYFLHVGNSFGIRITDPCVAGTANFVLANETYALTGAEPNALHPFSENYNHSSANGTGRWIHLALDTPVILEPGTTYGYDVVSVKQAGGWASNMFFESLGIKDDAKDVNGVPNGNPYPAGKAYTSGTGGVPADTLTWAPGDRVFLVELSGDIPTAAYGPVPSNKAWCATDQDLSWQPGRDATAHDVYFGTDLGRVALASRTSPLDVLKAVGQPEPTYDPGTLSEGVTYYWRIDEVSGAQTSKGNVWSLFVQPSKAFEPAPFQGEICVSASPRPVLSWNAGYNSSQSRVYLGTSPSVLQLKNTTTHMLGQTRYTYQMTGAVSNNTVYYWRVDQKQPDGTFLAGDLWQFKTIPSAITQPDPHLVGWWKFDEGPGKAIDWSGLNQHGTAHNGPTSAAGYDGEAIQFDGSDDYVTLPIGATIAGLESMTIATWVNVLGDEAGQRIFDFGVDPLPGPDAPTLYMYLTPISGAGGPGFTITATGGAGESDLNASEELSSGWHHLAVTLDASAFTLEMYVDGAAVAQGTTGNLPKDLGNTTDNYLAQSMRVENTTGVPNPHFRGSLDDFRIYNKVLTQQELSKAMQGDPLLAWNPSPANRAVTDVQKAVPLTWSAGDAAVQHDVYLGTDADAVALALPSDATGIYRGRQAGTSYTPPAPLEWGPTYAWRIDEVQANGTVSKGRIWTFTVADYLIVEDFESYDDQCNRIFFAWLGGAGDSGSQDPACPRPPYAGNGTGSAVGNYNPPFAEPILIHSGRQSMPLSYDNTAGATVSEATRTWDVAQDWTWGEVKALVLYVRGDAANGAGQLYLKVNNTQVLLEGSEEALIRPLWRQWTIDLASLPGLQAVQSLTLGVSGAARGTLYVDDIRLYRTAPPAPAAKDPGTTGLVASYTFEGSVQDGSGQNHNGTTVNDPTYGQSLSGLGQAIQLDGVNDHVELPIGSLVGTLTSATVGAWVNFDPATSGSWSRIFDFGTDPNTYMFLTPRQGTAGTMRFAIRASASSGESNITAPAALLGGWHHVAVVIDGPTRTAQIYQDDQVVAAGPITNLPADLGNTSRNWLGRSQFDADGYFSGAMDELRIYNRALSAEEVLYLAGGR